MVLQKFLRCGKRFKSVAFWNVWIANAVLPLSRHPYASSTRSIMNIKLHAGCLPAYGSNGNSRNVSCSKPSLHCHMRPWEGALCKWLTRSACDAIHMALYK